MRYQLFGRLGIAVALAASVPTQALAQSSWDATPKAAALKWELGYLTLSAIDAAQTIDCLKRSTCAEANPLFGKHPSAKKIILAKAGLGILHFAAFDRINDRNPKAALRLAQISCGVQGAVVMLNARFTFE